LFRPFSIGTGAFHLSHRYSKPYPDSAALVSGMEYNPNPTVYKPVRRKTTAKEGSLWVVDAHNSDDESDEPEPIDQDEIFGLSSFLIISA
jgi:hypothetical protein